MACSVHCCNSRNIELWWSPIFHATHSLPATEIAVKRVVCYCSSRRRRVVEMEIITVITFLIADHFTHVDLKIIHFICASCIIHICTKLIFHMTATQRDNDWSDNEATRQVICTAKPGPGLIGEQEQQGISATQHRQRGPVNRFIT